MAEKKNSEYMDDPKKNKQNGESQTENLIYGDDVKTNSEKSEEKEKYKNNKLNEKNENKTM